ncbi:MAG: hypothetical protein P8R42_02265 [Candidatus Binatia bacterium]|nr:hypothetical protein [Candidatus Binatia bacterium]
MARTLLPIYVDVDDVLADTTAMLLEMARDLFAKEIAYEDCRSFDLGESFGLSEAQRDRLLDAAHEDAAIESMLAIEDAAEVLAAWDALGHEVHIVTGRPPATLAATRRWLDRMEMPHASLASVDKYGRQAHLTEAVPLDSLAERRYRVAVEDSLSMARFLVKTTGTAVLLLDRPWNRDVTGLDSGVLRLVTRVASWREIEADVAGSDHK